MTRTIEYRITAVEPYVERPRNSIEELEYRDYLVRQLTGHIRGFISAKIDATMKLEDTRGAYPVPKQAEAELYVFTREELERVMDVARREGSRDWEEFVTRLLTGKKVEHRKPDVGMLVPAPDLVCCGVTHCVGTLHITSQSLKPLAGFRCGECGTYYSLNDKIEWQKEQNFVPE